MILHGSAAIVCLTGFLAQAPPYSLQPQPLSPAELTKRFTLAQIDLLEKLNRRDREHLVRVEPKVPGIVVPAAFDQDELAYSPMPRSWPAGAALPKIVVVDQPSQSFAAYENGELVKWGPVSSGRAETPTPAGAYHLTWRSRKRTSTDNEAWILEWYFNFINERGISFHQFDLPGYPASHACVRLLRRDAEWLYGWGEQWQLEPGGRKVRQAGTPVLIVGVFDAKASPAWLSLEWLANGVQLPASLPLQAGKEGVCAIRGGFSTGGGIFEEPASLRDRRNRHEMAPRGADGDVGGSPGEATRSKGFDRARRHRLSDGPCVEGIRRQARGHAEWS